MQNFEELNHAEMDNGFAREIDERAFRTGDSLILVYCFRIIRELSNCVHPNLTNGEFQEDLFAHTHVLLLPRMTKFE